ncbi:MAG TPA: DUF3606 domain-containing protein [Puia sp.]|nr:DUF3606 domain-containing protein [Puia sp.]
MEKKKTSRGISQDRTKVAGKQDYEVQYESKKSGSSADQVKKAIQSEGNSRKKVEKKVGGGKSGK